jgi:SulP family sulfate permease
LEIVDIERAGLTDHALIKRYKDTCVIYIAGPVFFANVQSIEDITYMVDGRFNTVIFSMRGASHLDVSGAQAIHGVIEKLKENKMDVIVCGLSQDARNIFDRSGITELVGEDSLYWSVDKVLADNRPHRENRK